MICCESTLVCVLLFGILFQPLSSAFPRTACRRGDTQPPQRIVTTERLKALRKEMKKFNIDGYYVPSTDAHLNEYVGPEFARRKWISGFSGSQGNAVVMKDLAVVTVDGRYTRQADLEMDCNWALTHYREADTWEFLIANNGDKKLNDAKIGVDTALLSAQTFEYLKNRIKSFNASVVAISKNLIDNIWTDRPQGDKKPLYVHPIEYAGETWVQKLARVRWKILSSKANTFLVTKLDEIAWLFNLRGAAIPYNPVFYAYAVVQEKKVYLFIKNIVAQPPAISRHLNSYTTGSCSPGETCVVLGDYETDFPIFLEELRGSDVRLWLSELSANAFLTTKLKERIVVTSKSPIFNIKVVKNAKEAKSFEECTAHDSAAYVEFMSSLFKDMAKGEKPTEFSAAMQLEEFRRRYPNYFGPSFETISSSGPNAAMNHYQPTNLTARRLSLSEVYLLDAGSQFLGCTTDITRTVHFGSASEKVIEAYTRVLAGFIDVASGVWPDYRPNQDLAISARRSLWQQGLGYDHGTGHGIGTFLSVHEFPNGLMNGRYGDYQLREGNYQSCEPGYYEDGKFGIRLETVLGVKRANTKYRWNGNKYLTFFPVAFVPFERSLIDVGILSKKQIKWVNSYHRQCEKVVGDILKSVGRTDAMAWLKVRTAPLPAFGNIAIKSSQDRTVLLICVLSVLIGFNNHF